MKYDSEIVKVLQIATEPLDTEKIRIRAGIGNWNTALKHCLELLISRKIEGLKSSKSWIFWVPTCKKSDTKNFPRSLLERHTNIS